MGIHGERFARADAEERGVERGRVVQEAALPRIAGAQTLRIGIEERVQVPVPVGGHRRDGVPALGDQLPQVLRGAHSAGVAAGHADDRDGLVISGHEGRIGADSGLLTGEFGAHIRGERVRRGMVEDEGGGEFQTGGGDELIAQFDGGERVEAEFLEGLRGWDRVEARMAEDGGGEGLDVAYQQLLLLIRRGGGELLPQRSHRGGRCGGGGVLHGTCRHRREERTRALCGEGAGEPLPVDIGHRHRGVVVRQGVVQGLDGQVGGQRGETAPLEMSERVLVGGHARLAPRAPGDAGGGEPMGPAVFGEGVEVRVRGGVGGLLPAAPGRGVRREEYEGVEPQVPGDLVQMSGGQRLGVQHVLQPLGVQLGDRAEVHGSGGVDDRGQGVFGGDVVDEVLQRGAVRDVARGDGDRGTQSDEFFAELVSARRVGAGPADEVEVGGALAGQPACEVGAEPAGAAGDERRTGRPPGRGARGRCGSGVAEAAGEGAGGTDRGLVLGLPGNQQGGQSTGGVVGHGGGHIDQPTPPLRVFEGGDPAQPPDLGLARVGERIRTAGGDRALCEAPQGSGDTGVAERLEQCDGADEPDGHGGVFGVCRGVEGEQAEHTGDRLVLGPPGQLLGEGIAPQTLRGERVDGRGGTMGLKRLDDGLDRGVILLAAGHDHQPGAAQGRDGRVGQLLPGGPVAPGVDDRLLAVLPPPRRQDGERGQERVEAGAVLLQLERAGEGVDVQLFDGVPQLCLGRVRPRTGAAGTGIGRGEPEPLVLEGVRRQRDKPGRRVGGEPRSPVDVDPGGLEPCQGGGERPDFGLLAGEGGREERGGGVVSVMEGVLDGRGQDGVRAEFEVCTGVGRGVGDGGVEVDGLADVLGPVRGSGDLLIGGLSGEVADEGEGGRVIGQVADGLGERFEDGVHQRGVEGVADGEHPRFTAAFGPDRSDLCDKRLGP